MDFPRWFSRYSYLLVLILNCRAVQPPVKSSGQDSALFSDTKRKCMSDLSSEAFCRQGSSTDFPVASLGHSVVPLCWRHTRGPQEDSWTAPEDVKREMELIMREAEQGVWTTNAGTGFTSGLQQEHQHPSGAIHENTSPVLSITLTLTLSQWPLRDNRCQEAWKEKKAAGREIIVFFSHPFPTLASTPHSFSTCSINNLPRPRSL